MKKKQNYSIPMAILYIGLAVTGIVMFFHVETPGMQILHEIFGLIFVAYAGMHIFLNWRVLRSYFPHTTVRILAAVFLVLGIGVYVSGAMSGRNPLQTAAFEIPNAPIYVVADLLRLEHHQAVQVLQNETGVPVQSDDTILAVSEKSGKDFHDLIAALIEERER